MTKTLPEQITELEIEFRNGFSFRAAVKAFEAEIITRALAACSGSITHAAHLVGFKHHQSLISILETRHPELMAKRAPKQSRKQSQMNAAPSPRFYAGKKAATADVSISVLCLWPASGLSSDLAMRGMSPVFICPYLSEALAMLSGNAIDAVVIEDDPARGDALHAVKLIRGLNHHRRTPIIFITEQAEREREAWAAGVSAFMLRPQTPDAIIETIKRALPLPRIVAGRAAA